MHNFISQLDSERFGFEVAKISPDTENTESIVNQLIEKPIKLIIARINFSDIRLINRLEKLGFLYKDAQVTFNFNIQKNLPSKNYNEYSLVSFEDRHLSQMIEITRTSFDNYGHYFADDELDKQKCNEIYIDWIQRCSKDKKLADEIIIAEKNDVVLGYLAIKMFRQNDEQYFAGVIGAVSSEYRNLGVFKAINIESLYKAASKGYKRVENNVLITNIPVIKTYTGLCYSIIRSEITMHYWKK